MLPSSHGKFSQKPQLGIPLSIAHIRMRHSLQHTLFVPASRQPVHLTREGRIKEPCPSPSCPAAMRARAFTSLRNVALRASHASQSIPQQPILAINLNRNREPYSRGGRRVRTPVHIRHGQGVLQWLHNFLRLLDQCLFYYRISHNQHGLPGERGSA